MKTPPPLLVAPTALLAFTLSLCAAVIVDDTFADGSRAEQNPPVESAWFANFVGTTPTLSTAPGALTGNVLMFATNTGSRLWITHFTPAGSPVTLATGDVVKVTLEFTPNNVTASGTSRGLRFGLFNFSAPGATRVAADGFSTGSGGGAPGANVPGYMLNMNFAQVFNINSPLQIMKRTDTVTNNLMGTTGAYTALASGGGAQGSPGFASGRPYTLEYSAKLTPAGTEITTKFSDTNGWSISQTATDPNNPTVAFDTLALRPATVADTAESVTFTRLKVEHIPYSVRIQSIRYTDADGATFIWGSIPGKSYRIEWRPSLNTTDSWQPLWTVDAGDVVTTYTDRDAMFEPQRFYQVIEIP